MQFHITSLSNPPQDHGSADISQIQKGMNFVKIYINCISDNKWLKTISTGYTSGSAVYLLRPWYYVLLPWVDARITMARRQNICFLILSMMLLPLTSP